jgi:hypothetical protein
VFYYEFDPDSYEPDNTASAATNLTVTSTPQTQNHTLHNGYDQDWYRFQGIPGLLYVFYSTGSTDTQIYLYADDGTTQLGFNDDSGEGLNYRLEFAPSTYGYYRIKVIPYTGNAGPYGFVYYYGATPDAYEPDNTYSVSTTLTPTTVFQSQPHTLHDGTLMRIGSYFMLMPAGHILSTRPGIRMSGLIFTIQSLPSLVSMTTGPDIPISCCSITSPTPA